MLIYFSVKNFRSIRDEVALDMRTAPRLRRLSHHAVSLIDPMNKEETKVLRSAVMYGANASGKSNIIRAIEHMKRLVLGRDRNTESISTQPFKLDSTVNEDTTFYIEFSMMDFRYAYGFSLNKARITNEYLYLLSTNGEEFKVFERTYNNEAGEYVIDSGANDLASSANDEQLKEFLMLIKYTEDTKLFVTESVEKKLHEKIEFYAGNVLIPYHFFKNGLRIIFPNSIYTGKFKDINEQEISKVYKKLLTKYDTGIDHVCTEPADLDDLPSNLIAKAQEVLTRGDAFSTHFKGKYYNFSLDENDELQAFKIVTCRKDDKGQRVDFDLDEESDGTSRLFDIIRPLIYKEDEMEVTYIIDEFDRSLHPNISRDMIDTFLNKSDGKSKAQLIVTTHESNLLDNELLRRDEIWFVQKERDMSTQLYSLNDYSTRFDKDIKNAYLRGVFGGVPYLMEEYKG